MLKPVEFFLVEKCWMVAVDIGKDLGDYRFTHHFSAVFNLVTLAVTVESSSFIIVEHNCQLVRALQFGVLFLHLPAFYDKGNRHKQALGCHTIFLINLIINNSAQDVGVEPDKTVAHGKNSAYLRHFFRVERPFNGYNAPNSGCHCRADSRV